MQISSFDLERWQSQHEHEVEINLSESGVHPLRVRELVEADELEALLGQPLEYTQTNGTLELRERIAALHPGATAANVLVSNGGAEANFLVCWRLVEPGDEVVVIQPTYMQVPGVAASVGAELRVVWLEVEKGHRWRLDLDAVRAAVTPRTSCIALCNPNNPTGNRLTEDELIGLCNIAAGVGCWLFVDEIYRGAELDGHQTPSAWGRYERVLVTGGLSKAYGLPGLRVGWVVGPVAEINALWGRHDYTTIAPGAINDQLARLALTPSRRKRLIARTRRQLRENQTYVEAWVGKREEVFQIPPEAGGVTLLRYSGTTESMSSSVQLAEKIRAKYSVLVVPGAHFGLEYHLRIGIGGQPEALHDGLTRLGWALDTPPKP